MNYETLKARTKMRVPYKNRFLLVTMVEDKPYAIADKCPHMGSSLLSGVLEGCTITCKDHGLPISVVTGDVTDSSKADFLKLDEFDRNVRSYPLIVENGKVYIK